MAGFVTPTVGVAIVQSPTDLSGWEERMEIRKCSVSYKYTRRSESQCRLMLSRPQSSLTIWTDRRPKFDHTRAPSVSFTLTPWIRLVLSYCRPVIKPDTSCVVHMKQPSLTPTANRQTADLVGWSCGYAIRAQRVDV